MKLVEVSLKNLYFIQISNTVNKSNNYYVIKDFFLST